MNMITHRVSPQQARYTPAGGREKCAFCRFYIAPKWCGHVTGPVSPMGWCKYFSQEMRAQFGGSQVVAIGPPGATLDLGFMTPGTLDSRIAFTRASTGTYTDSTGTLRTAAVNQPRWDYAAGVLRGLLIEEARMNIIAPSIPGAGWGTGDATLSANAGLAPDGTNTMTRLAEAATTAIHLTAMTAPVTASVTNTFSIYAKAAQVRYLQIFMDNGANVGSWVTFDLQSGVISGALAAAGVAIGTASITSVGNGVWRCVLSGQIGAATTARVLLMTSNVANPGVFPSYAGNTANGLLLWGAQLEQALSASSYFPTTGAGATRAFDNCFISSANMAPWFASPGGSWFAEFIDNVPPTGGTSPRIIGIHDGTSLTPLWVQAVNPLLSSYDGGQLVTANAVSVGAISKGVSFWAGGAGRICLNGGAVVAGAMSGGFATLATAGVGILGGNPGVVNETMTGYIRRVQYWPRALSDTEMQQVTT